MQILNNFYHFISKFVNSKKLVINSIPKSGTHLLAKTIELTEEYKFQKSFDFNQGDVYCNSFQKHFDTNTCEILKFNKIIFGSFWISQISQKKAIELFNVKQNHLIITHLLYSKNFLKIFKDYGLKQIIIFRDPVSVINSTLNWINTKDKILRPLYKNLSSNEKISTIIHGDSSKYTLPLLLRYKNMFNWLNYDFTMGIKYENLVGPLGGGNAQDQINTINSILNFLKIKRDPVNIAKDIYGNTVTFDRGKIKPGEEIINNEILLKNTDIIQKIRDMLNSYIK